MSAASIFKISTPFAQNELADIGFEQSADIVFLTHVNHNPQELKRFDHNNWTIGDAQFGTKTVAPTGVSAVATIPNTGSGYSPVAQVYAVTAIDQTSLEESLASSTATCTNDLGLLGNYNTISWSAVTNALYYNVYEVVNGVYGYIGTASNGTLTFKDQNILPDLSNTPPQNRQPFAATGDKPAVVTFYEQRAVFGRTLNKPNAIYTSQSGNFLNMDVSQPTRDSDAITIGIVAKQVNAIANLVPMRVLIALTGDVSFAISGSSGFLTPAGIGDKPQSYRGASNVRPVQLDDIVFFHTSKGNAIRTLGYQYVVDGYRGDDVTVFARHLFKGLDTVRLIWTQSPTSTIYALRSDGAVNALTWQAEQQVWGWTVLYMDGFVEDGCAITEHGEDVAYFVVRRTVNGQTVRFMERLTTPDWASLDDACYLDASRSYSGALASSFGGMHHLEGRQVWAVADGSVFKNLTVTGGVVTLPYGRKASNVTIGLNYEAFIQTLPMPENLPGSGSSHGRKQMIGDVILSVVNTRGIEIAAGVNVNDVSPFQLAEAVAASDFDEVQFPNPDSLGQPPPLFTGDIQATVPPGDWTEATLVVRQAYPLPMRLTGVSPDITVGG